MGSQSVEGVAQTAVFKPFLVEGGRDSKNIFRIIEITDEVSREQIEKLFEKLPMGFQLRRESSESIEDLNEPLEVYVSGGIIRIYPQQHRFIACANLDSWNSASVVSQMHVDNIADFGTPHRGQIRSCVHFFPTILGIEGWPHSQDTELEIDIFAYPVSKIDEIKLIPPRFGKFEVEKLLKLIAGGDRDLTVKQLQDWRELIMYAVMMMRSNYERPDVPEDYSTRKYYKANWKAIEESKNDEELARALNSLRGSIQYD